MAHFKKYKILQLSYLEIDAKKNILIYFLKSFQKTCFCGVHEESEHEIRLRSLKDISSLHLS